MLERLYKTILDRKSHADADTSYVVKMINKGRKKIAQKLGEEAVETVIDAVANKRDGVISESADLLFHLTLLWADMGIEPKEVAKELERREGKSGIEEKNSRKKD